jgi:hypothetical protein
VARDKLRYEQAFRLAKHHAPSVYGEKVEHQHKGPPSFVVNIIGGAVEVRDVTPQGGTTLTIGTPEDAVL